MHETGMHGGQGRAGWQSAFLASVIAILAGMLTAAPPAADLPDPGPAATAEGLLERVVAVGASATHGFHATILVPIDGRPQPLTLGLADALAAVLPTAGAVHGSASEWFFTDPDGRGRELLDAGLAHEPTLLIAVDHLFWFGYGATGHRPGSEEDARLRRERLERGLAMLQPIETPMLVGDLPDMSGAVGRMLSPRQVPTPVVRETLNARIRAWAAERPATHLVPLAETMRGLMAGERFGVTGRFPLLKPDRLHPTADGLLVLARVAVEAGREAGLALTEADVELDHAEGVRRLQARLAAAAATAEPVRARPEDPASGP